jgi:hypothetical protein
VTRIAVCHQGRRGRMWITKRPHRSGAFRAVASVCQELKLRDATPRGQELYKRDKVERLGISAA